MVSFMKKTLTLITLLFLGVSVLQAQTVPRDPQVIRAPDVPAPKYGSDGKVSATFLAMHERFLSIAKEGKVGLLFLGDSITAGWGSTEDIWYRYFGRYKPANFGVSGDRTQPPASATGGSVPAAAVAKSCSGVSTSGRSGRAFLQAESQEASNSRLV